jgi:hypothetical protein
VRTGFASRQFLTFVVEWEWMAAPRARAARERGELAVPWKPLLHFNFNNHAALDETRNGFHGQVELPAPDRWVNQPISGISTAIRYDHPESKIVVATQPAFAGWRGLRVRAYFTADDVGARRLNLVEGDGSFALFTAPGGVLHGTINDGSQNWWGISSRPGRIRSGHWHLAELLYDSGQVLTLSVDGQMLGARTTAGLPILPVRENGIRVGYWAGGDSRYTFQGLMGPIWVDTLDEREEMVSILVKLLCEGTAGASRLEDWHAALDNELTNAEKQAVREFGTAAVAAVKRLSAVVVGQAADPAATLDALMPLADEISRLALQHESGGTDLLKDPALSGLLAQFLAKACEGNPAAAQLFQWQALQLIAANPLTPDRWEQIRRAHPEWCMSGFPPVFPKGGGPSGPRGPASLGWLEELLKRWCARRGQEPGGPEGPGGPAGPDGCSAGHRTETHVHVHCDSSKSCRPGTPAEQGDQR